MLIREPRMAPWNLRRRENRSHKIETVLSKGTDDFWNKLLRRLCELPRRSA